MEWNAAYDSETFAIETRENGEIRLRFKINVQDTEIGELKEKVMNDVAWFGRELVKKNRIYYLA